MPPPPHRSAPCLECLETRELPAVSVSLTAGGDLRLVGYNGANTVHVYENGTRIMVRASSEGDRPGSVALLGYDRAHVHRILFYRGDGNDKFVNDTAIPCAAYGGPGHHAQYGGDPHDNAWNGLDTGSVHTYWEHFDPNAPFYHGISATDINQGNAPTCSVLAVLAAAAQARLPLANQIHYLGHFNYEVRLTGLDGRPAVQHVYFDGTWTANDPQPPRDKHGRFLPEFWTILFQRAYLQQMHVNWRVADSNRWSSMPDPAWRVPEVALLTVTGLRSSWDPITFETPQHLQSELRAGCPVVALTQPGRVAAGIVAWHTYTLTKVHRSGSTWYVTLRNPWGNRDDASRSGSLLDGVPDGFVTLPWRVVEANFCGFAAAERGSARA
jgi:hypothetical protein